MPSHLVYDVALPRPSDVCSSLQRRVHELAAIKHDIASNLPRLRSFHIRKDFLDVIEVVWWADALQQLGDELHALGWSVLFRPTESSVELRVWEHRDSEIESDSESSEESGEDDPAAP